MLGKKSTVIVLVLSILSCHISAVVSQETDLKATYKSFRNLVDTFTKYTRISKRAMTDKEWQEFQTTAKRIGVVGVILVSAFVLKKGIQSAWGSQHSGIHAKKKDINLASPLTDDQFRALPILDRWQHVIVTGNWDRLKEIILQPVYNPLHEIILTAKNHDQNIVDGLTIVLKRYPSKINEFSKRQEITPVWQAVYELQNAASQSVANRLAQAITFLLNQGADISFQEKLYGYASKETGTLQQAVDQAIQDMKVQRIINVNAPEIQEMQEIVKEKFAEKK